MIDFETRKEKNIFNNENKKEDLVLTTEQTNILFDITNNQIKNIWKEINRLKCQIYDIINKINNEPTQNEYNNNIMLNDNNKSIDIKKNLKDEILDYINKEIKKQININVINSNQSVNNNLMNANNFHKNNDTFKLEKQIQNINGKLFNHENYISSLNINKLNKNEFNEQIILINNNFKELNKRILPNPYNNISDNNINEDDIMGKKNIFNQYDLNEIKKELSQNFEKVNLKILNELKNQASDIKYLYQEINNFNCNYLKNNKCLNINKDINNQTDENIEVIFNQEKKNSNINKLSNLLYSIKEELSKKVDLEQLNYALKQQEKLNEVFSSSSKICKLCWDSDDILIDNKYIKWSYQNINTALDIFKWDNNSETIKILQKGIYRVIVGLIGLENEKDLKLIYGDNSFDDKDIININKPKSDYNEKENVKYIEKYIACIENTELRILLVDKNNNREFSEEAFVELKKII